ncbi:MAG: DNA primase [Thiohalomonadaceae bacterium]
MGRIPQDFIDDLLSRVDIVEVVDTRVPLKKAGREFVACCPFHNEKTPSFTVSPTKQFYHCFGCGAHGNAIGFLMAYEHLEFVDAIETLAAGLGLTVPREGPEPRAGSERRKDNQALYDLLEDAGAWFRQQLRQHPERARAVDYLKRRGLSGEIARDFGIGYAPPGWQHLIEAFRAHPAKGRLAEAGLIIESEGKRYDRFRDRIMFPIRDSRGRYIGFGGRVLGDETPKYLNSPETPVFHKGRELYGFFEARQALRDLSRILVVEGYMDVVALAQYGIRYAVATLGTAVTREHLERLFRTTQEVVFCFDGDRAGRDAAWRGLENALPLMREGYQVRFMFLPEGEDPDSLVRKIGREAFEAGLGKAIPLSQFFIDQLRQEVDLGSLDGRAQLVEKVRPLLAAVPEGIYRHLLLERLAEFARVAPDQLGALLEGREPVRPQRAAAPQRPGRFQDRPGRAQGQPQPAMRQGRSAPSAVRHALSRLVQEPGLAAKAGDPARFSGLRLPGVRLLAELITLLQRKPGLSWGAVLEHWRGTDEGRHLARLAAEEPLIEEPELLEHEFVGALHILEREFLRQRREELEERFKYLSEAEKLELNQILIRERSLRNA